VFTSACFIMSAEVCLHFAAIFLSYFLKVTAAFFACWIVTRLVGRPRQHFVVWMVFLAGSAAYWLELVLDQIRDAAVRTVEVSNSPILAPSPTRSFILPLAWSHNILIAVEGLGVIYVLVFLVLIGITAWNHLRLHVLLRHAIDPSTSLRELFVEISRDMHLSQSRISRTRLMVLPGLKSPATAGWWNPRILLPEVCEQIGSAPQVADVLCHELIHVARRDYLWARLSDLVCCVLFFHPTVWKARKAMVLQGELACDLAVLETRRGDRADYADSLTYFVRLRMLQEGFSLGVDFAASTSLGLRVRTILAPPKPVAWWKRYSRAAAGLSLIAAFGVLTPFMALSLGFSEPFIERIPNQSSSQAVAGRFRSSRRSPRRATSSDTPKDSLTTLRTRSYVQEAPAYTMTNNSNSAVESAGSSVAEQESSPWRENRSAIQHPSVSSVIRATLGEIAVRGTRGGRDHDRDDH
jgi:beta-lactamase regulating signal transducer with metallopeptidase domain